MLEMTSTDLRRVKGKGTVNSVIFLIERAGAAVAAACIIAMMVVITADSIGRYFFHSPLPWVMDVVTQYLMIVAVYFGLSDTFRMGDHIRIDLFRERMSPRARAITGVVYSIPAALVFAVIAYGNYHAMADAYQNKEFLPGYIPWPVWLSHLPIALGALLLTIRLIHHASMLLSKSDDPYVAQEGEQQE
jgi:TRAP-type C4-dicarboxylate transport system permease small subunit